MGVDWGKLKFFKRDSVSDNWGNPDEMDEMLLLKLDDLRRSIESPIIVTSGWRKAQPAKSVSQHWYGRAVDIVVPDYKFTLLDLYMEAERYSFGGIGVYPDWEYKGQKVGGLHIDERIGSKAYGRQVSRGARWIGVKTPDGQKYLPLTAFNLYNYGAIIDLPHEIDEVH